MSKSQREKGILLSYITMGVNFLIGILFTPFITNTLGTSEYGLYSLASSIIAYLSMLDLGFGNSMIRFNARARAKNDQDEEHTINGMFLVMFSIISVIALIVGLILYFNIGSFFDKFTDDEIEKAKVIFLILLVNTCISFPFTVISAILSTYEQFAYLKLYNLITSLVKYGLEIVVMLMGFKSIGVAAAAVIVSVSSKIFPIIHVKRRMRVRFSFKHFDKALFKEIIVYSGFIFINIIVDRLYADTDKIILGKFVGSAAVAVYGVASNLGKDFMQFSTSISGVFLPNITKLITKDVGMKEISKIFVRIGRIQFIILSFIFSGFLIYGKYFIRLWVGEEYAEAYYIAVITMAPSVISLSQNIGVTVLQAMNRHRIRSVMYLVIGLVNVLISIPLAIKWGGTGAAIGTVIGNLMGQLIFMNWYYHRKIGLDIPGYWRKVVLRIGSVTAVYCVVGFLLNQHFSYNGWLELLLGIGIYTLIYIPLLWFAILNREEKKTLIDKIHTIKKFKG